MSVLAIISTLQSMTVITVIYVEFFLHTHKCSTAINTWHNIYFNMDTARFAMWNHFAINYF